VRPDGHVAWVGGMEGLGSGGARHGTEEKEEEDRGGRAEGGAVTTALRCSLGWN
jgi:hypothetical protein